MKNIYLTLISFVVFSSFGQTLKAFSGPFEDGRGENGTATYSYYEDPETREYTKQGAFKYVFNGKNQFEGFEQTISGNFDKGLKNGNWTYKITLVDFKRGNIFYTGTVVLVTNYKNGYADGNWKEVFTYKTRSRFIQYGAYKWEPYTPLKNVNITMNFKGGDIVGAVNIDDEEENFKATGSYDANSITTGTWVINDLNKGVNLEIINKDNYFYEFIGRSNSGEILDGTFKDQIGYDRFIKDNTLTSEEKEETGMYIDTLCGKSCEATSRINSYFGDYFLNNDFFLYKYIKGDRTFYAHDGTYTIRGGCSIRARNMSYTPLSQNYNFKKAAEAEENNSLIEAYTLYNKVDLSQLKPSDRKKVAERSAIVNTKVDQLLASYFSEDEWTKEFIKSLNTAMDADFNSVKNTFKIKQVKVYNQNTRQTEEKQIVGVNCAAPWDFGIDNAYFCFEKNLEFYEPYQRVLTLCYLLYTNKISEETGNVEDAEATMSYKSNNSYTYYAYEKETFNSNIAAFKKIYDDAKTMMDLALQLGEKSKKIELLNDQNKKKTLFSKYSMVLGDFQTKYLAFSTLETYLKDLIEANAFLDKVINLYAIDSDAIEKQLKSAETVDQIKQLILQ